MNSFQKRNPNLFVFNAMLHLDEASPHLHIDFIPFYTKGRVKGLSKGVSMAAALTEQGFTESRYSHTQLTIWVESERGAMEKILHSHGFVREDKHVTHKHMSVAEYKQMVNHDRLVQNLKASFGLPSGEKKEKEKQELKAQLFSAERKLAQMKEEQKSPYNSFYYSSADKQAFVQDMMRKEGIPFRETDNGFEAQECHTRRIREIEKSYQAPSSTIRDRLRDDVDSFLYQTKSFDEFLEKLQAAKYEVRHGKYLSAKPPYGQRFIRLKSLGSMYDEFSLRNRQKAKNRFEIRLDKAIQELETKQAPNLSVLHEVRHYITFVKKGALPIRRQDNARPYSWVNDQELDKLLRLNTMLNEGMTADDIRQKAETLEAAARDKSKELERAENDLRVYMEMKEKIEMVFEGKPSDAFTLEQAKAAVREYPDINRSNYRNIDKVVNPAKEKVKELSGEHQAIRAELKQVTDVLSIIEKTTNHTFVQHLVKEQTQIAASELFMNGIFRSDV